MTGTKIRLLNQLGTAHFFWRDRQKNEVDVVLENKVLFPIEVKFPD